MCGERGDCLWGERVIVCVESGVIVCVGERGDCLCGESGVIVCVERAG